MSNSQMFSLSIILLIGNFIHYAIVGNVEDGSVFSDVYSIDCFFVINIGATLVELGAICGAFWLIEHVRFV